MTIGYTRGMTEQRISRRAFIGLGLATTGTALAAEVAWTTKVFEPNHVVTDDVLRRLKPLEHQITPFIRSKQITLSSGDFADINPEYFASALIRLAYLDGGLPSASQVTTLIKARGLDIVTTRSPYFAGMVRYAHDEPDTPITMGLDTLLIEQYYLQLPRPQIELKCYHEMYHIVQIAGHPEFFTKSQAARPFLYKLLAALPSALFTKALHQSIQEFIREQEEDLYPGPTHPNLYQLAKRLRIPASLLSGFTMWLLLSYPEFNKIFIDPYLNPIEQGAYLQTGTYGSLIPPLINIAALEDVRGKLFTYTQKNEQ